MRQKALCLAAALVMSLAVAVHAAETETRKLPEGIYLHASVDSFTGVIENADAAIAAITENTANPLPPGFLGMIVQMQMPFPMDAWDTEEPIHLLLPREARKNPVILVSVESFDAFVAAFEESGAEVEELDTEGEFEDGRRIRVRGAGRMEAVPLSDTIVAVAEDWEDIVVAMEADGMDEWTPEHPEGVNFQIAVNIAAILEEENAFPKMLSELDGKRDEVVEKLKEGVNEKIAEPLTDCLFDLLRLSIGEMEKVNSIAYKLTFDGDDVVISANVDSRPESFLRRMGLHMADKDTVSNDLSAKMSTGAVATVVYAAATDVVPASIDEIADFYAEYAGRIFPDKKDRVRKHVADAWKTFGAGAVVQGYLDADAQYNAYFMPAKDAKAAAATLVDSFAGINEMIEETIADQTDSIRLVIETGEIEGLAYTRVRPEFTNPETAAKLKELILEEDESLAFQIRLYENICAYIAAKDDVVVMLMGSGIADGDLLAMANMLDEPGEAMLEVEAAERVTDLLENAQACLAVIDADKMRSVILQQASMVWSARPEGQLLSAAAEKAKFVDVDDFIAFAGGSDEGCVSVEVVVPTKVINGIVRNYEAFKAATAIAAAERMRLESEDEEDEPEVEIVEEEETPEAS